MQWNTNAERNINTKKKGSSKRDTCKNTKLHPSNVLDTLLILGSTQERGDLPVYTED